MTSDGDAVSGARGVAATERAPAAVRGQAGLRRHNTERILSHVTEVGGATRAQIARSVGLSPSTATVLVAALLAAGALVEGESVRSSGDRGRPGRRLTVPSRSRACVAVELDHTMLRMAVAAGGTHEPALRREIAIDGVDEPARVLAIIAQECGRLIDDAGLPRDEVDRLVLGVPAPVHPDTGVIGASLVLPEWRSLPVAEHLGRLLGIHVEVDNDANLAVLAEVHSRQARHAPGLLFVKASGGLGASLYLNGQVHRGVRGAAGEIGHVRVPGATARCRCGDTGCLETMSSTTALFDELTERDLGPRPLRVGALTARAVGDDHRIAAVLRRMGAHLGSVVAAICTVVDLDRVVIGGELSGMGASYVEGIIDAIDARLNRSLTGRLRVEQSTLGCWGVVEGALIAGGACGERRATVGGDPA